MNSKKAVDNWKFFLLFAAPTLFIFATVMLAPFFYGLFMSFTNSNGMSSAVKMVGFKNYADVIHDSTFWSSFLLTIKYVIACVVFTNIFGFIIGYLLTTGIRGQNFLRGAFFTPNLLGGIVLGLIWKFIFQQTLVFAGTTLHIPIFEQSWLTDPTKAFMTLVVVTVWQMSGYMMIIYIAGFMSISKDIYEVSSIDGCNTFTRIFYVIIPLMVPSFVICIFLTMSKCFMAYDVNISLTGGDPFNSTVLVSLNIFREAFSSNHYGTAQSQAFFLFLMVAIAAGFQTYFGKKLEVEQ
jgi:raffinose/stachyose/melibiose transport system permease protein